MKLSPTLEQKFNDQIRAELFSSNIYKAMEIWCNAKGYLGAEKWFLAQAAQEYSHAQKFIDFMKAIRATPVIPSLDAPGGAIKSLRNAFEQVLEHEELVTLLIENLSAAAIEEKHYQAREFLDWFLAEQVEEVDVAATILDRLNIAGDNAAAILMIDAELGA